MKKKILILIFLISTQNLSYAAFPVLIKDSYVSDNLLIDVEDKFASTSMIISIIAILFLLIAIVMSGYSKIFPLFLAILMFGISFIFGVLGLKSKTKKWQAYIGLIPGLLVALFFIISTGSIGDPDADIKD